MNLLFVDHAFHKKTRSSDFFKELLHPYFTLTTLYIDPDDDALGIESLDLNHVDVVLLWQMDFLAPAFIAHGIKVVVIPMYDGSANMPDIHWYISRQARFINFSVILHNRIQRCGAESLLLKYFPKPSSTKIPKKFDEINVLFWQRRPEHGINLRAVEKLLGDQITSLHIHDAPDDKLIDTSNFSVPSISSYNLTRSTWFSNQDDYKKLLDDCNVYIAPRLSEGIGMGFIEAMSKGMLVFASDYPTHSEYISNWVNGVLVNFDNVGYAEISHRAHAMAEMALTTCDLGYKNWIDSHSEIITFIKDTQSPIIKKKLDLNAFTNTLAAHYYAGLPQYVNFLKKNNELIRNIATSDVSRNLYLSVDGNITYEKIHDGGLLMMPNEKVRFEWLEQNRFNARSLSYYKYLIDGDVNQENDCLWVSSDGVSFGFSIDCMQMTTSDIKIKLICEGHSCFNNKVFVTLNGKTLCVVNLENNVNELQLGLPNDVLKSSNIIRFQLLPQVNDLNLVDSVVWGVNQFEFV